MTLQLRISRELAAGSADNDTGPSSPRRVRLEALMGGDRELIIEHRGEDYRLRLTSNGKLLLTK